MTWHVAGDDEDGHNHDPDIDDGRMIMKKDAITKANSSSSRAFVLGLIPIDE
jgi:hypothetical protein